MNVPLVRPNTELLDQRCEPVGFANPGKKWRFSRKIPVWICSCQLCILVYKQSYADELHLSIAIPLIKLFNWIPSSIHPIFTVTAYILFLQILKDHILLNISHLIKTLWIGKLPPCYLNKQGNYENSVLPWYKHTCFERQPSIEIYCQIRLTSFVEQIDRLAYIYPHLSIKL